MTARRVDRDRVIGAALDGLVAGFVFGFVVAIVIALAASLSPTRQARPCEVLRAAAPTTAGGVNGTDAAQ